MAATCGFVDPRDVRTLWERGRYLEYLFAFSFFKPIQDYYGKPLISSGCFSIYRTRDLARDGRMVHAHAGRDMDLTWTLYEYGQKVRFVSEAMAIRSSPTPSTTCGSSYGDGPTDSFRTALHWRSLRHLQVHPFGGDRGLRGRGLRIDRVSDAASAAGALANPAPARLRLDMPAILVPVLTAACASDVR